MIGHGDGLGPGDYGYKRIKKIFTAPLLQWAFRWVHPDVGIALANRLSRDSRAQGGEEDVTFQTPENEWLWSHCKDVLRDRDIDCFLFGHRHLPLDLEVPCPEGSARREPARYINLGDWIHHFTCAKIIDGQAELLRL
jgi:UDP-2,3-diacylglucosamine hydrolase